MNYIFRHWHKSYLNHLHEAVDNQLSTETPSKKAAVKSKSIPKKYRNVHYYDNYDPKKDNEDVTNKILMGDRVVLEFCELMSSVTGYEWFDYQDMLLKVFLHCGIPNMYWEEWSVKQNIILERFGLTEVHSQMISETARREGKSTIMVATSFGFAATVRPRKSYPFMQGFVSVGLEASKRMIRDAINLIDKFQHNRHKIRVTHTKLWIIVSHYDENDRYIGSNIIRAYQTGQVCI